MPRKTERIAKPAKPQKSDRWTVRGVPPKLQKAAGDAARARGLTLGQWLSGVLGAALPQRKAPVEATERWEEAVERRLARLEVAVFENEPRRPEHGAAATALPS
jgi:hypothetical protein